LKITYSFHAKGVVKSDTPKDTDYDSKTKIGNAIAKAVGCSVGSNNTISAHTKCAKVALGLSGAAGLLNAIYCYLNKWVNCYFSFLNYS